MKLAKPHILLRELKRLQETFTLLPTSAPLTLAQFNKAHDNDGNECHNLGICECVLYSCAPLDIGTVHKCQQT